MKTSTTILAALFTVISLGAMATNPSHNEPVVKILPNEEAGFLKLLYVNNEKKHVKVAFYGEDGMIIKDRIKASKFDGGFVKKYDLTELKPGKYWVQITDSNSSVRYQLIHSSEKPVWASYWSNADATEKVIASK